MISAKFALLWNLRWATGGTVSTSTGGPPVATAKSADATAVVHRWGFGGTSVTTGGLRLISNPGKRNKNLVAEQTEQKKRVTVMVGLFYYKVGAISKAQKTQTS